jgi:hypothetical protein
MSFVISQALDGAIETYDDLLAAITDETDGQASASQLAAYIRRAEARIRRKLAIDPVRPMMVRADITVDGEYVDSPADMVRPFGIELTDGTDRREVVFVETENATGVYSSNSLGRDTFTAYTGGGTYPDRFTMLDGEFRFYPVPDTTRTGTLFYYQELPAISVDNQNNWLLEAHPDAYLSAALYYAYRAMPDIDKAAAMKAIFEEEMAEIIEAYPKPENRQTLSVDSGLAGHRFYGW